MSDGNDILNREIVIAGKLEENGLAIRVKSRAIAALDGLLGSLIDIPAAFAEGVAGKQRIKNQINERFLLARAEFAEKKLLGLPHAGDALLLDMMKDAGRKQINSAGVAIHAIEELKCLPRPADQSQAEQDRMEFLDEDWLNQFRRYAEDASSENLQQLWGRILAGEINSAGSFSRHTLRFMAELDQVTAENCQFAADYIVHDFIPWSDFWQKNEQFMIAIDLSRLGLIEGAAGDSPSKQFTIRDEGYLVQENRGYALVVEGVAGTKVNFPAMPLTRLGNEVFSLLAVNDETASLRDMAKKFERQGVSTIKLGTYTPHGDGIRFVDTEVLFTQAT